VGSNNAAGYQLSSGLPVMAVGGFNGTDPAPTLEQFQKLVADGEMRQSRNEMTGRPSVPDSTDAVTAE
jgi:hypothetical protein